MKVYMMENMMVRVLASLKVLPKAAWMAAQMVVLMVDWLEFPTVVQMVAKKAVLTVG